MRAWWRWGSGCGRRRPAVEGEIYQVRNRSNQDPLNFPIKVNNRLANLLSMVGAGGWEAGERDVRGVRDHGGEGGGADRRGWMAVWEGELEEVNARAAARWGWRKSWWGRRGWGWCREGLAWGESQRRGGETTWPWEIGWATLT